MERSGGMDPKELLLDYLHKKFPQDGSRVSEDDVEDSSVSRNDMMSESSYRTTMLVADTEIGTVTTDPSRRPFINFRSCSWFSRDSDVLTEILRSCDICVSEQFLGRHVPATVTATSQGSFSDEIWLVGFRMGSHHCIVVQVQLHPTDIHFKLYCFKGYIKEARQSHSKHTQLLIELPPSCSLYDVKEMVLPAPSEGDLNQRLKALFKEKRVAVIVHDSEQIREMRLLVGWSYRPVLVTIEDRIISSVISSSLYWPTTSSSVSSSSQYWTNLFGKTSSLVGRLWDKARAKFGTIGLFAANPRPHLLREESKLPKEPPEKLTIPKDQITVLVKDEATHMEDVNIDSEASATEYEVMLSCHGGGEFIDCLQRNMLKAGISVFIDDKKLHESGAIGHDLPATPSNFKIYIPIFSEGYASSARCLSELKHMVDLRTRFNSRLEILPIFYDVEPADVGLKTELYTAALKQHKRNLTYELVQLWEGALKEVAGIKGWELRHKDYIKLCRLIVGGVLNKLKVKHKGPYLVGVQDQVESIKNLIDIESRGVSFVAIHGKDGIGKTTLAKVVFDQMLSNFDGSSFLSDVQESSKHEGLEYLQDQLFRDILNKSGGTKKIRERFRKMKVLIVLDDVDERDQIKKLAGKSSWYGSGSRVIVTTRNINVVAVKQDEFDKVLAFEVPAMNQDKALQLFCMHAFGSDAPPQDYYGLSKQIVDHIGGLPLALEILGSSLNRKCQEVWGDMLKKLEKIPYHGIHDKLMLSYEALDSETRQIFLDIALFFVGMEKASPVYMWDACDFFPEMQLEILGFMCLLKTVDRDKFWMHELVRDLGKELVRRNDSRLWMYQEVLDMLKTEEGEENIEARGICYDQSLWDCTSTNELKSENSLTFLELHGGTFKGEFKCSLSNLKWLSWHSCPVDLKVASLRLNDLVVLDLSRSSISYEWEGWSLIEMAKKLKVLNLTSCKNLIKTPDFSNLMSLERLILEDCEALAEIDASIGKVQCLKYLNIRGCNSLTNLPEELCNQIHLEKIVMRGDGQLFELPAGIGLLTSLSTLEVVNVKFLEGTRPTGVLKQFESLSNLSDFLGLKELPDSLGDLESLQELDLSKVKVAELPNSIGNLRKLKVIKMESSSISMLPSSIGGLENLEELYARNCNNLHGPIPAKIGRLTFLRILDLSFTSISSLPHTINELLCLEKLHLESCNDLEELPELPKSLVSLHVKSRKLQKFPSLSELKSLVHLQLFLDVGKHWDQLSDFHVDWSSELSKLETLELCIPNVTASLKEFSPMSNLSRLCLSHVVLDDVVPHLRNLEKLSYLDVVNCSMKDDGLGGPQVAEFKSLEHLSAHKCNFVNMNVLLSKKLRMLSIKDCHLLNGSLDLSELRNLLVLELTNCEEVSEVRGLGEIESLEDAVIHNCDLLQTLGDLSKLQRLELLKVHSCDNLKTIEGLLQIKSLKFVEIYNCRCLGDLHDKSKSKKQKHKRQIKT
ncbi:TMV resistance protein N-like isoform X1 [Punica granatum]|uniref:TMV resistance protein N-like isoform X1 n=3 Tax=Punica granatum TaxID=22663 RepID=A0A6P8BR07_PUNGR|nr:TMV resistance protein N-like isoform X1 [Punica granatum]XP_031372516.1 TMV resistance protein N-like isoform X1 [Punica granatum]XP_031372517.1 TMV resistance protein N-like isoform X1 [Punica granatum]